MRVLVNQIEDGMILAEDLRGPSGNILLQAGMELRKSLARRLQAWGIVEVSICEQGDLQAPAEGSAMPIEDLEPHLRLLFQEGLELPTMQMIFQATLDFRSHQNG
jgi:hypothetical protein